MELNDAYTLLQTTKQIIRDLTAEHNALVKDQFCYQCSIDKVAQRQTKIKEETVALRRELGISISLAGETQSSIKTLEAECRTLRARRENTNISREDVISALKKHVKQKMKEKSAQLSLLRLEVESLKIKLASDLNEREQLKTLLQKCDKADIEEQHREARENLYSQLREIKAVCLELSLNIRDEYAETEKWKSLVENLQAENAQLPPNKTSLPDNAATWNGLEQEPIITERHVSHIGIVEDSHVTCSKSPEQLSGMAVDLQNKILATRYLAKSA